MHSQACRSAIFNWESKEVVAQFYGVPQDSYEAWYQAMKR